MMVSCLILRAGQLNSFQDLFTVVELYQIEWMCCVVLCRTQAQNIANIWSTASAGVGSIIRFFFVLLRKKDFGCHIAAINFILGNGTF